MNIPVHVVSDPETLVSFLLKAAPSLLGTLLGFVFALVLAWLQRRYSATEKQKEIARGREITLKLAIDACAANSETLLSFKSQFLIPLSKDVDMLRLAVEGRELDKALELMSILRFINQGYTDPGFIEVPSHDRFSFLIDDIPFMTIFVHRTVTALKTAERLISERNLLLQESARANGRGMQAQEFFYFTQMAVAYGDNLTAVVDDGLAFTRLLHDQIHNYGKHMIGAGKFRKFEVGKLKPLMPPDDYLVGYPEQMVDFSKKAPRTPWRRLAQLIWPDA